MGRLSSEDEIENDLQSISYSRVMSETTPRPRRSFHRSSSSAVPLVNPRRSFSYDKLSDFHLQLTIVKLDGSSFEVEIRKAGKIGEIKKAVENIFNRLPTEEPGKISWPQVWGHFCLSYGDQKLLNDNAAVRDYGIKEADEHLSIDTLTKMRSPKRMDASKSYTIIENEEEEEQQPQEEDSYELKDPKLQPRHTVEESIPNHESEKCNLFGVLFGHPRLSSTLDKDAIYNSRICGGGVLLFIRRLCGNRRPPNYSSRVSQV